MTRYKVTIYHQAIAVLMKQYQEKHGLTLREMQDHFDISYTSIKRLADGREKREVGVRVLAILADVFDIPASHLYYIEKKTTP